MSFRSIDLNYSLVEYRIYSIVSFEIVKTAGIVKFVGIVNSVGIDFYYNKYFTSCRYFQIVSNIILILKLF